MASRRQFLGSLVAGTWAYWSSPVLAGAVRRRALLIAPSEYNGLPPQRRLAGPDNDVVAMKAELESRDFDQIVVLADHLPAAGRPTRAAILRAFEDSARDSRPGDLLLVYFSGHGAQQPVLDPARAIEKDGFDEVLLPTDVGRWRDADNRIENALIDDEVGHFITECRRRGAFVWMVVDACHSADSHRASWPVRDAVERGLSFDDLAIPRALWSRVRTATQSLSHFRRTVSCATDAGLPGGLLAFFAASSQTKTIEARFPRDDPNGVYQGVFTHMFLQQMRQIPPKASYLDLMTAINRAYQPDWTGLVPQYCADPPRLAQRTRMFELPSR